MVSFPGARPEALLRGFLKKIARFATDINTINYTNRTFFVNWCEKLRFLSCDIIVTMEKKLIIGNWKMNPETQKEAKDLAGGYKKLAKKNPKIRLVACPPAIFLPSLSGGRAGSWPAWGGQDAFFENYGPHTGSISPSMLKYSGAEYVILGHSERRQVGETDEIINKKVKAALKKGLKVVLCVGEESRHDHGEHLEDIKKQLEVGLGGVVKAQFKNIVIAYEPIWAVGVGGVADSPESFLHNAIFIRKVLSSFVGDKARLIPVIYGGSVDKKNALGFLAEGEADGLLIGRASLRADHLGQILQAIK